MELVNLKPKIKAALRGVKALKDVSNVYPDGAPVLPMATFEEIVNVPGAEYDGEEYASEIAFYIRIWGNGPEDIEPAARQVHAALTAIGGRRGLCRDDYSGKPKQKLLRYSFFAV